VNSHRQSRWLNTELEDVDTSPSDPTRAVLGNQNFGTFTFDFDLDFSKGSFDAAGSGFSIEMLHNNVGPLNNADNVEWSAATVLGDTTYPEGLIFVNEDHRDGQIWVNEPDGSNATLIGDTAGVSGATESTGILDISDFVGYNPGSILLSNNQGSNSSLTVLINPDATLEAIDPNADFDGDGDVDGADFLTWQHNFNSGTLQSKGDADFDGDVDSDDLGQWESQFGGAAPQGSVQTVPEPATLLLGLGLLLTATASRRRA